MIKEALLKTVKITLLTSKQIVKRQSSKKIRFDESGFLTQRDRLSSGEDSKGSKKRRCSQFKDNKAKVPSLLASLDGDTSLDSSVSVSAAEASTNIIEIIKEVPEDRRTREERRPKSKIPNYLKNMKNQHQAKSYVSRAQNATSRNTNHTQFNTYSKFKNPQTTQRSKLAQKQHVNKSKSPSKLRQPQTRNHKWMQKSQTHRNLNKTFHQADRETSQGKNM